jgi:Helix-turn-helix domain
VNAEQVKTKTETRPIEVVLYPDGRLDAKSAAAYLGLSEKTLAMMRCQGRGPRFVKRGRVFYFKDDLDAWIAGGRFICSLPAGAHARWILRR